ncbi:MAG: hypothetical protein ABI591_29945 [Kofleriaceae bacterium]
MTRSFWFACLWVAATPALSHAEPTCAVSIVRAPDDVRAAVESWLAKETCTTPLTVRIIETEGGYYIYAVDDHGRVEERIVPDAQSAGVLIASWTADDGIAKPEPPPQPIIALARPAVSEEPIPPVAPTPTLTLVDHPSPKLVHSTDSNHWLTLAAGAGGSNRGAGARVELELMRAGSFTAVVHLAYGNSQMAAGDGVTIYNANFDDLTAMVGLHYTWRFAPAWHVRAGFAVGVMATQMTLDASGVSSAMQTSTAVSEGSLMVGYTLADRWEVEIGPVATLANEHWHLADQMETLVRAPGSVTMFAGVRRAL